MHLQIAEQICVEAQRRNGRLHTLLQQNWPAFYFGSVAPDYQSVCGIPRVQTHFYDVPPEPDNMGYNYMWQAYPAVRDVAHLPPEQAMFVAGYSVHLLYDVIWLRDVVDPFFFRAEGLGERRQRILIHFILLTYLDKLAVAALPETAVHTLAAAHSDKWLPFADNKDLLAWRDLLLPQLEPGAMLSTVAIYAERLKMTPAEFAASLDDSAWMAANVFGKLPVPEIQAILTTAVPRSVDLLLEFFNLA
ncbi:MAG: zinc dependent phospholipase C family protein [Ardenticatenaceae bacterium]|nr:zinc dependent phospholipase C family protein [Ardenticatenaceae bacterium]